MTYEDVKRIRNNPTAESCEIKKLQILIDIAIEKQIPKKLKHEYDWYTCPSCGEIVIRYDNEPKDENYRYCSWCGQRLDRSAE